MAMRTQPKRMNLDNGRSFAFLRASSAASKSSFRASAASSLIAL
jgi:hypothetical protein